MTETNQLLKAMLNNVTRNEDVNYTLEEDCVYFHDQKEISDSRYVWKLTFGFDGYVAFSEDGGRTYQAVINPDFAFISPDLIKTGFNPKTIERIKEHEKPLHSKNNACRMHRNFRKIGGSMILEYRTCIATEAVYPGTRTHGFIENIKHNAVFHLWAERQIFCQQSPTVYYYGQPSITKQTVAIVEYEDGTIHEHLPREIQFTDGKAENFSKNKKDDWNKLTEDTDSYPETYENVLFKTSDGRIYYGCCGTDLDWSIEIENGIVKIIKDVVEWRKIQS